MAPFSAWLKTAVEIMSVTTPALRSMALTSPLSLSVAAKEASAAPVAVSSCSPEPFVTWASRCATSAASRASTKRPMNTVTTCPRGLKWQRMNFQNTRTRSSLKALEEQGVYYVPHQKAYRVSYLDPVQDLGDCLFLSVLALLKTLMNCSMTTPLNSAMTTCALRAAALEEFWSCYDHSSFAEKCQTDSSIQNQYFPSLSLNTQTHRYVSHVLLS